MSTDTQGANGSAEAILRVGTSRGFGLGLAAEFARRGWGVVGTVRGNARTGLHAQANRVDVETLNITDPGQSRRCTAASARVASTCCS